MRKQTIALSAAILSLAATGSIAVAQTDGPRTGGGSFTRAEAQARASAAFERMDVNNDGRLDQADRTARQNARFDRIDTDGDGSLSRAEFAAMQGMRGDRARGDGEARQDRRGKRGGGKNRMGRMGGRGMMQNLDANGDGAVTQAEFTAQAMSRFAAADADNDGTVTAAERKAARKAGRAARAN